MAKGVFIRLRAKLLEEGERNSSFFFRKMECQRKALTTLNIDGVNSSNPNFISRFVTRFYGNNYSSKFNTNSCRTVTDKTEKWTPVITDDYETICDSSITIDKIKKALQSMKKRQSSWY